MQATFNIKRHSKSVSSKKSKSRTQKNLILFCTIFYQVLCNHNPNIIASDNDSIEYLAEQVWDLDIISLILVDTTKSNNSVKSISEQEIVEKICDVVNDDFLTFEVSQNRQECLEICQSLVTKLKTTFNPTSVSTQSLQQEDDEDDDEEEEEEESHEPGTCELCHRHMPLTFHHLIPRAMHKRVLKKGLFTKEECLTKGTNICRPCHSACHKMISHEQMAYEYNTMDKLLDHEGVIKFVTWASKQKEYSKDHVIRKLRYSK